MSYFYPLVSLLAEQLQRKNFKLAVAESCTGGLLAAALTDLPGSSAWFDRALITYSNAAKQEILGIDSQLIDQEGAVSCEVVKAMVEGIFATSPVDCAVATSGIAGPSGGSIDKPVGTVWIAVGIRGEEIQAEKFHFLGDRQNIREQAVEKALIKMTTLL